MCIVWRLGFLLLGTVSIQGAPTQTSNDGTSITSNNGFGRVGDAADLDQLLGGIDYLYRYCYLAKEFGYGGKPDIVNIQQAIHQMQRIANIAQTDRLDSGTLFAMRSPRCGMCDVDGIDPDITLRKSLVRYNILNYPSLKSLITPLQVKKDIATAFRLWSEVIPVDFELTSEFDDTDIAISFGAKRHGAFHDRIFDSTGGAVAHIFKDVFGDFHFVEIHFDDDEVITRYQYYGQNLFYDAAHQIGHVLGLGHNEVKEAIMWPYQKGFVNRLQLSETDIRDVQAIHGVREGHEFPLLSTTAAPKLQGADQITGRLEIHSACADNFAAAVIKTELHVLQGQHVWIYKQSELTENTVVTSPIGGYKITKHFKGLHNNQDLAYTKADGNTVFIRGRNYWLFDGTDLLEGYPKKVSDFYRGVPKNAKAAFHDTTKGVTYFFKGDRYWRFSDRKGRLAGTSRGFSVSDGFEGLPADITAAFADRNGYRFMFKGQQVWRYSSGSRTLDKGYPRLFPLPNCQ